MPISYTDLEAGFLKEAGDQGLDVNFFKGMAAESAEIQQKWAEAFDALEKESGDPTIKTKIAYELTRLAVEKQAAEGDETPWYENSTLMDLLGGENGQAGSVGSGALRGGAGGGILGLILGALLKNAPLGAMLGGLGGAGLGALFNSGQLAKWFGKSAPAIAEAAKTFGSPPTPGPVKPSGNPATDGAAGYQSLIPGSNTANAGQESGLIPKEQNNSAPTGAGHDTEQGLENSEEPRYHTGNLANAGQEAGDEQDLSRRLGFSDGYDSEKGLENSEEPRYLNSGNLANAGQEAGLIPKDQNDSAPTSSGHDTEQGLENSDPGSYYSDIARAQLNVSNHKPASLQSGGGRMREEMDNQEGLGAGMQYDRHSELRDSNPGMQYKQDGYSAAAGDSDQYQLRQMADYLEAKRRHGIALRREQTANRDFEASQPSAKMQAGLEGLKSGVSQFGRDVRDTPGNIARSVSDGAVDAYNKTTDGIADGMGHVYNAGASGVQAAGRMVNSAATSVHNAVQSGADNALAAPARPESKVIPPAPKAPYFVSPSRKQGSLNLSRLVKDSFFLSKKADDSPWTESPVLRKLLGGSAEEAGSTGRGGLIGGLGGSGIGALIAMLLKQNPALGASIGGLGGAGLGALFNSGKLSSQPRSQSNQAGPEQEPVQPPAVSQEYHPSMLSLDQKEQPAPKPGLAYDQGSDKTNYSPGMRYDQGKARSSPEDVAGGYDYSSTKPQESSQPEYNPTTVTPGMSEAYKSLVPRSTRHPISLTNYENWDEVMTKMYPSIEKEGPTSDLQAFKDDNKYWDKMVKPDQVQAYAHSRGMNKRLNSMFSSHPPQTTQPLHQSVGMGKTGSISKLALSSILEGQPTTSHPSPLLPKGAPVVYPNNTSPRQMTANHSVAPKI